MKKINKIIILLLIAMGIIIGLINESKAAMFDNEPEINKTYGINFYTLQGKRYSGNNVNLKWLYCVNHGAPLGAWQDTHELVAKTIVCTKGGTKYVTKDGVTKSCQAYWPHDHVPNYSHKLTTYVHGSKEINYAYTVLDKIYINENKTIADGNLASPVSTGSSTRNEYNAKLAYILANGDGYTGENNSKPWYYSGGLGYSKAQMAVYYNFRNFITPIRGAWGNDDRDFGANNKDYNDIIQGANEYWGNLQKWQAAGGIFTDNSGDVNTNLEVYSNKPYIRVGPLKWTYPGNIESIDITDQNGNSVSVKYKRKVDGEFQYGGKSLVKSDKNFYILIPADKGVTEIKAKIKISENATIYYAEIALLNYSGKQNLIQGKGGSKTISGDNIKVSYTLGTGNLKIYKTDKNKNDIPLPNVQFKIKHKATGLYIGGTDNKVTYETDASKARIFTTNTNGKFIVRNIVNGNYLAIEVKNPNLYYPLVQDTSGIAYKVEKGETDEYSVYNKPDKGDLKIIKEDVMYKTDSNNPNTEVVKMGQVGFKLQSKTTGLWVAGTSGNLSYTADPNAATEFKTNTSGEIIIKALLVDTYRITETSNKYGDKKDNNKFNYVTNIGMGRDIKVESYTYGGVRYTNIQNIYNAKDPKSVKISGYVWQFKKYVNGKEESVEHINNSRYNNLSDKLYSEEFKSEVSVRLYKTAQLVIEKDVYNNPTRAYMKNISEKYVGTATINAETGEYSFTIPGIRYPEKELPYYKIRFTYNGFDYEAAIPNYNDNDLVQYQNVEISNSNLSKSGQIVGRSKALENAAERKKLNETLAIISGNDKQNENWNQNGTETYGSAWNLNGKTNVKDQNKTAKLTYEFEEGKEGEKGTSKLTKIEFTDPTFSCNITATYSLLAGDPNGNNGYSNYYYKDTTGNTYGEVKRINLGLIERYMPDLSTSTQIENVVTSVNGYNNLYKTTFSRKAMDPNGSDLKIGVTYVTDEDKLSNFTVYPSDVQTWADNSGISDKLKVYITYKVAIKNETKGKLYNRIREFGIYYDQNYELKFIGTDLDTTKNNYSAKGDLYTNGANNRYYYDVNTTNCVRYSNNTIDGFKKAYVDLSKLADYVIGPGESKYVYLTYKVADTEIQNMLTEFNEDGSSYTPTMKNIVEINAYSTYSKATATNADLYAGIDLDSAAGNIKSTEVQEMDDDTDLARAFKISQKDDENSERTLTGKVFLDTTDDELKSNEERKGDSIYREEEDKELNNLKIKLIGKDGVKSKNIVEGIETETTKTEYEAIVKGKDNDGNEITLEGDNTYFISGFIPGDYTVQYTYNNETYYYDENGEKVKINTIDYKSAIVKDETKDSTTTKAKTAFKAQKKDQTQHTDWYKLDNPTNSTQTAESFVRYNEAVDDWNTRNSIDEKYKNVTIDNTGEMSKEEDTNMTATTPVMEIGGELNTQTNEDGTNETNYNIVNIDFGITERPRQALKVIKNVTNLRLTLANGQVLEDATITKDKNGKLIVEGTKKGVTAGAATEDSRGFVKLELDSELIHGSTLEIVYDMKTTNISEKDYELEDYYKYGEITDKSKIVKITPTILDYASNKLTYERDTIVEHGKTEGENRNNTYYNWNKKELDDTLRVGEKIYKLQDLFNENQVLYKEEKNGNVVDVKKGHINTMLIRTLGEDLAPGEDSEIIKLGLSKLLSNDNEDMTYNNDVEIITAEKTWGRTIYKQLGTYIQENNTGIGGSAEEVTITPPTGLSEDNITYYILLISGLLSIVASGLAIVLIKRKK